MAHHELLLYTSPTCPYCARVVRFIQEKGLKLPIKNVKASVKDFDEFRHASGGTQVPCLMIDGKPMLESLDIIEWLKENVAHEPK